MKRSEAGASVRWTHAEVDAFFHVCRTCPPTQHLFTLLTNAARTHTPQGFAAHGRDFVLLQRDFLPHKDTAKVCAAQNCSFNATTLTGTHAHHTRTQIKYMFGKITKQINGLIAPQTIARVRDQRVLQHVFASYHTLLLQQRAADDPTAALLAAVSSDAAPQPKRARSTPAADTAAFRRAVDAALAAPVAATGGTAAAAAAGAHPSPATSTLSSASPSPSPLAPGVPTPSGGSGGSAVAAPVVVHAEQKMSLSLAPRDEPSRAVVARCGFTPFLVLTFKMARRTLGSIVQHLALKWFSGVHLRMLPAPHAHHHQRAQQQQQQQAQQKHQEQAGGDRPQKPRKPAAVRYGMGRITLVLQHGGSGAVVGSWDRRNGTLFSDFVPTLPTSISAPVLASSDAALPVLYTIAGIAPDDVVPLPVPASTSDADDSSNSLQQSQQQQQQSQSQQQSAAWREQTDSIPQFHSFGRPTPSPPPAATTAQGEEQHQHQQEQVEEGEEEGRQRRNSSGTSDGHVAGAGTGLEGGELSRLGDDAGGVVHIDKSFTSFVLENADAPGASLLRAGLTSSQFPSPLRACAALAPSAQATPQTPMRALFSTSAACSPATLATPTFAALRSTTAGGSTTPSGSGSGGGGALGTPTATGVSPERLPFFASVVCALPGDAGASRDGLPKEDSQLALFPERSLGYSNPGLPFLAGTGAGAGSTLGLGVAMGSAAAAGSSSSTGAPSFSLFSGGSNF